MLLTEQRKCTRGRGRGVLALTSYEPCPRPSLATIGNWHTKNEMTGNSLQKPQPQPSESLTQQLRQQPQKQHNQLQQPQQQPMQPQQQSLLRPSQQMQQHQPQQQQQQRQPQQQQQQRLPQQQQQQRLPQQQQQQRLPQQQQQQRLPQQQQQQRLPQQQQQQRLPQQQQQQRQPQQQQQQRQPQQQQQQWQPQQQQQQLQPQQQQQQRLSQQEQQRQKIPQIDLSKGDGDLLAKYPYTAKPGQPGGFPELTIKQGERLLLICKGHTKTNNNHWWEVRNDLGEQGFVPAKFVLELEKTQKGLPWLENKRMLEEKEEKEKGIQENKNSANMNGPQPVKQYQSAYDSTPATNAAEANKEFFCNVCDKNLNGPIPYKMHMSSKAHREEVEYQQSKN